MTQGPEGEQHTTIIKFDHRLEIYFTSDAGHWFRLFRAIIQRGFWANLFPSGSAENQDFSPSSRRQSANFMSLDFGMPELSLNLAMAVRRR